MSYLGLKDAKDACDKFLNDPNNFDTNNNNKIKAINLIRWLRDTVNDVCRSREDRDQLLVDVERTNEIARDVETRVRREVDYEIESLRQEVQRLRLDLHASHMVRDELRSIIRELTTEPV